MILLFMGCVSIQFGPGPFSPLERYGMIGFGDTIQVDQTEILLGEWIDYMQNSDPQRISSFIRRKRLSEEERELITNTVVDNRLMPDSSYPYFTFLIGLLNLENETVVIRRAGSSGNANLVLNASYFTDNTRCCKTEQILNSPVTGVTFKQAIDFCSWRTKVDLLRYGDSSAGKLEFGLISIPTFKALTFDFDSLELSNKTFNYSSDSLSYWKEYSSELAHCHNGLWDMFGNAAEMVNYAGLAIGGSRKNTAQECFATTPVNYSTSSPEVGFRCLARVLP